MAYSTILEEHRRRGASFDEALDRLADWAAQAADDAPTSQERAEERIARQNAAAMGQIDSWMAGAR